MKHFASMHSVISTLPRCRRVHKRSYHRHLPDCLDCCGKCVLLLIIFQLLCRLKSVELPSAASWSGCSLPAGDASDTRCGCHGYVHTYTSSSSSPPPPLLSWLGNTHVSWNTSLTKSQFTTTCIKVPPTNLNKIVNIIFGTKSSATDHASQLSNVIMDSGKKIMQNCAKKSEIIL